jgi:Cdc25 family phosphatase
VDEFATGHIVDAKNIPSGKFQDEEFLQSLLINDLKEAKTIVVHCAKSQQRGPTCARALSKALEKLDSDNKPVV